MPDEDLSDVRGIEMTDDEIAAFLEEQGHGTLSLTKDDRAYGVPISYGYDGDRLYVHLIRFGDDSEKLEYLEETTEACLTTYEAEGRFKWRSAIARGPIREVPDEEADHVDDVISDNAWIPSLFPPTDVMQEVKQYMVEIDEASGRKGEAYQ